MADSGKLILVGGAAVFAWWQGWLASLGIPGPSSASAPPATPPPGSTGTPTTPTVYVPATTTPATTPPATVKLADLFTKFNQAAQAAGVNTAAGLGPDDYNYILVQQFQAAGLPDPGLPDPNQVFGPGGWSRPQTMSVATYWAGISQWLAQHKGMSGLRGYAGLAGLARRYGWGA